MPSVVVIAEIKGFAALSTELARAMDEVGAHQFAPDAVVRMVRRELQPLRLIPGEAGIRRVGAEGIARIGRIGRVPHRAGEQRAERKK